MEQWLKKIEECNFGFQLDDIAKEIQEARETYRKKIKDVQERVEATKIAIRKLGAELDDIRSEMAPPKKRQAQIPAEIARLKEEIHQLNDQRVQLSEEEAQTFGMLDEKIAERRKYIESYLWDQAQLIDENLVRVRKNEKIGFVDLAGKEIMPCQWDAMDDFCEGRSPVEKDDKWGEIDQDGSLIEPLIDI